MTKREYMLSLKIGDEITVVKLRNGAIHKTKVQAIDDKQLWTESGCIFLMDGSGCFRGINDIIFPEIVI